MKEPVDIYVQIDDAIKRIRKLDAIFHGVYWSEEILKRELMKDTTLVEVICCKDCEYFKPDLFGTGYCKYMTMKHHNYEACSFGERKAEDG